MDSKIDGDRLIDRYFLYTHIYVCVYKLVDRQIDGLGRVYKSDCWKIETCRSQEQTGIRQTRPTTLGIESRKPVADARLPGETIECMNNHYHGKVEFLSA